jgi:hypothetical protein
MKPSKEEGQRKRNTVPTDLVVLVAFSGGARSQRAVLLSDEHRALLRRDGGHVGG